MKKILDKIIDQVKNHTSVQVFLFIFYTLMLFFVAEVDALKEQHISFLNFLFGGLILYVLYCSAKGKKLYKVQLCYAVTTLFVMNRWYDAQTVEQIFHVSFIKFGLYCFVVLGICFLLSLAWGVFYKVSHKRQNIHVEEPSENGKSETKLTEQKNEDHTEQMRIQGNHEYKKEWKDETQGSNHTQERVPVGRTENRENGTEADNKKEKQERKIFAIILISLLVISILLYMLILIKQEVFQQMDYDKMLFLVFPFITILLMFTLIVASFLALILKIVQTIIDIIWRRNLTSEYILYGVVLFAVVLIYNDKNQKYTLDDLYNMISEGNVFSFPLVLAIILPVIVFLIGGLVEIIKKQSIAQEIGGKLGELIKQTIKALLQFVEFVTIDFLSGVICLVRDDINETEENERKEGNTDGGTDEKMGEQMEAEQKGAKEKRGGD